VKFVTSFVTYIINKVDAGELTVDYLEQLLINITFLTESKISELLQTATTADTLWKALNNIININSNKYQIEVISDTEIQEKIEEILSSYRDYLGDNEDYEDDKDLHNFASEKLSIEDIAVKYDDTPDSIQEFKQYIWNGEWYSKKVLKNLEKSFIENEFFGLAAVIRDIIKTKKTSI
jgi:hypothetical protein